MTTNTDRQSPTRLNTQQASEYLGIPAATLRWFRHTNQGPRSYRLGHRAFYDLADLQEWEAAQKAATQRGGVDL